MLGITFSSTEDLKTWGSDVGYTADLLQDPDRTVAMAYGAADSADQEKPARISVLVGPDGKVAKTYADMNAEAHPAEVLAELG